MHKVAVYGSLLSGLHNNTYLKHSRLVGECTFRGKMFDLSAYPACASHGNTTIHAELYEIDDGCLKRLDALEGHPRFYQREIIETSLGPAWVYLMQADGWLLDSPVVKSGNWREYYNAKHAEQQNAA